MKLYFIKQSSASSQEANKEDESAILIMRLWKEMEGDQRNGINSETLKIFTAAIMKILLSPESAKGEAHEGYGKFNEEGVFLVSQEQATRIHKEFNLLYLNKTAYGVNTGAKSQEDEEYSFKPSICEKSITLAGNAREKIVGKEAQPFSQLEESVNSKVSEHVEILSQKGKELEAYYLNSK